VSRADLYPEPPLTDLERIQKRLDAEIERLTSRLSDEGLAQEMVQFRKQMNEGFLALKNCIRMYAEDMEYEAGNVDWDAAMNEHTEETIAHLDELIRRMDEREHRKESYGNQ
jgi:hypothetical protein